MYPHNATPGARPTAPVFGTLGDASGVDARHGQFLVGFDLSASIPTNLGPSRYLIRRCRLSATVSRDRSFVLDPTSDGPSTFLPADHPDLAPDSDPGRPIEVFGVGFRNGFDIDTFLEDSPFGSASVGQRNAFAAGYDANGSLIDVGNNAGKTDPAFPPFDAVPFAVGTSATLPVGEPVPAGSVIDFELNLADPLVAQYLQQACHGGRLRLMVTSLQTSGFGGQPAWAEFHTKESVLGDPPRLFLSGVAIRPDDSDGDLLPDDWERLRHGSLAGGADADADRDGLPDLAEWEAGTDPMFAEDRIAVHRSPATGGSAPRLRFRFAPSRRYDVVTSADLRTWTVVPGAPIRYEPGSAWASFPLPAFEPNGSKFFGVRATAMGGGRP
ncbi:MAG: hypothetical protein JNL97_08010 [Verrucomicrobiales bacterium]|nr:hypothetical protein [Verrucomicrobiales bacterium]